MRGIKKILGLIATTVFIGSLAGCQQAGSTNSGESKAENGKTVEVALVAENAPYTYADEDGKPAGYDYEVLKLIDDALPDYNFNYSVISYDNGLIGTKEGKYDLNAGAYFRTDAREETYLISDPYNYFFLNLIVKPDSNIKSLEDLNGKTMAPIVPTDGRYAAFSDWLKEHPDVTINMDKIAESGAMADEVKGVENGTYDAAFMSAEQAKAIFEQSGLSLTITDVVGGRDTTFLMNKNDTELQTAVNDTIKKLTDDGTLPALTKKWFDQDNFAKAKELGLK